MTRHWYLDWEGPRPERDVLAAAELVISEQEASEAADARESAEVAAARPADGAGDAVRG